MKVRLALAYDGTEFRGWQRQSGVRTVQGVLQGALGRLLGEVPDLSAAGRTDAGVHARGQVVSFVAPDTTEPTRLRESLNGMLGPEIAVLRAARALTSFDARMSATAREYRYRILTDPVADPFRARFEWHLAVDLDVAMMRRAARELVGEHDFASFCRAPQTGTTVRRLQRLSVGHEDGRLVVTAKGNAFLHQMVRTLVGTLVAVGRGRIDPDAMPGILEARDRSAAGQMAPAHGLTLERVIYGRRRL